METYLVLTIDIGTSSCKVCVFDARGEILKTSKREYPAYSPAPVLLNKTRRKSTKQ